jgi:glycosyltransferase involved in cell wall biosynthesis
VSDILKPGRIDLIHVDTIALNQFVPSESRTPAVLTHHNIESQLVERRARVEKGTLAKWYLHRETDKLRSYEAEMVRRYDVNIVVSGQDERSLLRIAPGLRTMVVPNGVDVEYFTPDPNQEGPALIYTGGMNMFANRDAILFFLRDIWPLIREQHATVRFFAVGQDPPRRLKDLALRDSRIVITGYVTDIRPLVRQASVYVVPLRVGGGTRLKVLDAMAMGKAIVSTSIGCEGIDLGPGEHVLVADSPHEFAKATLALLADKSKRDLLGKAVRSLAEERYSWRTVGTRLIESYREAIAARGRNQ